MLSEDRAFIIESSLRLERNLSILLSNLLFISDTDNSKTLGNKSSALSFNTKADILLDTDFITSENRKKFQLFMEIRNQFAHNKNCSTYSDCIEIVDGCEKRLNNFYSLNKNNSDTHKDFQTQFKMLIDDLNSILEECQKTHLENFDQFVTTEFKSKYFEELQESLISNVAHLRSLIDFELSPENLERLKEILIVNIIEDAGSSMKEKMSELDRKIEKRKLKEFE